MSLTGTAKPTAQQQRTVRVAARALARAGLVHAYGHCSLRLDEQHFLVCAAKPMGLITSKDLGRIVPIHGDLPNGVLGEVRIHQQIYRRRKGVGGIVRSMPRDVMTLSAAGLTPMPRHGIGTYFSPGVPLWNDIQLVRTDRQAQGVADQLDVHPAVVMRGNGAVVAGKDLAMAVALTWYLEDAARVELQLRSAGLASLDGVVSPGQAKLRATSAGRIFERMWAYLATDDPEWSEDLETEVI